ncbi:complex I NDUFA9 subunit family protein [Chitiniphilus eburneus]|uniref:Complex I NDUFA9 subunit family protein n=1 Tax=Chitiniphilus eburneus TaxID=2571148 RepID=A0A4U0QCC4_9NEIS|nr:complex I NDUFA9 subunit family protein [Chitiniphilus eburneus]TJZ79055.1 complex I NDUFA9 subunit family protein [Chitiniphilus eburneus]
MPARISNRERAILLIGGSGFIGSRIAARLAGAGHRVTVPTRREANARDLLLLPQLDIAIADVHQPAQLAALMRDQDVVINLVGILQGRPAAFQRAHLGLTEKILDACHATNVMRYLHMSALGADLFGPSHYLRSKGEAEARVRASELDWTIYRPSVVFGEGDRFLNLFASMQRTLPVVPLACAKARFQPVWVGDVARAFEQGVLRADLIGQSLNLVGPQVYTLAELVKLAGQLSGHPRPILPLAHGIARVEAALMALLPNPPLSRDNLDSMRHDSVDPAGFPAQLGFEPASLEAVAPTYLKPDPRLYRWRHEAHHPAQR